MKSFLAMLILLQGMALAKPPNILLLVSDDHHYTSLGCLGNNVIRTPYLDRLARDGVLFTHCFSPNPICTPMLQLPVTNRGPSCRQPSASATASASSRCRSNASPSAPLGTCEP